MAKPLQPHAGAVGSSTPWALGAYCKVLPGKCLLSCFFFPPGASKLFSHLMFSGTQPPSL